MRQRQRQAVDVQPVADQKFVDIAQQLFAGGAQRVMHERLAAFGRGGGILRCVGCGGQAEPVKQAATALRHPGVMIAHNPQNGSR